MQRPSLAARGVVPNNQSARSIAAPCSSNAPAGTRGMFERPIGIYRMAYSYVGEPSPPTAAARPPLFHFAPHCSQTSVYFPVLCSMAESPEPLRRGSVRSIDRQSAYWAMRVVKQTCRGLPWARCLQAIQDRQRQLEARAQGFIEAIAAADGVRDQPEEPSDAAVDAFAREVVAEWWVLLDELLVRYGDGWEHEWDPATGARTGAPIAYPLEWLEQTDFFTDRDGGGGRGGRGESEQA